MAAGIPGVEGDWSATLKLTLFQSESLNLRIARHTPGTDLEPVVSGRLQKKLGLTRSGFHSLRHGAASSLLAAGATPAVVQRQLRHSDARITLGIYGHVVGDEQRNVVQNRATKLVN